MTCSTSRWVLSLVFVLACGGDDGGDDTGNDTANDDETPASDDFAPQDEDASASNSNGETAAEDSDDGGTTAVDASSGAADSTGASGCVGAGQACGPNDYCNTWICTCNSGDAEFMTVGSCEAGVCTTDGTVACEPICTPSGGVASAVDGGCG